MMLAVNVHPSRAVDLRSPDTLVTDPPTPFTQYRDDFDNLCTRLVAPAGGFTLSADFMIADEGQLDPQVPDAAQTSVERLPDDLLIYLLGSRYCETDRLSDIAWSLFGGVEPGWKRVQAIVDWVHGHIAFGYAHARPTKTAWDAYEEGRGVCRDYAHLAITFCRCMNVPARYCTGYLGDIGVPISEMPMDFAAWMEVWLNGRWYVFDPRNHAPRIGRILMARGRDATDAAIATTFGVANLVGFEVITEAV